MSGSSAYTLMVPVAMLGIFPLVILLFAALPKRRAAIASYLIAWLFLPEASYEVSGLPDLDKVSIASLAVMTGILAFDLRRLAAFRLRWYDAPILCLLLIPLGSSLANGLGVRFGASSVLGHFFLWGVPYLVGRLYCSSPEGLRDLGLGIVLGSLVYVPFCLWEVRMSPNLHAEIYGFHPRPFNQNVRWGGYRPGVFMRQGLQVGLWMATGTLVSFSLWYLGGVRRFLGAPMAAIVAVLLVTTILCKALTSVILLVVGFVTFAAVRVQRSYAPVLLLAALPLLYVAVRAPGWWDGWSATAIARVASEDRASSLSIRILNENRLLQRALNRPILGWGGWGRHRIWDSQGKDVTTTDGRWIILLGMYGILGLGSFLAVILMPPLLLGRRIPKRLLHSRRLAPAITAAVVLSLWMIHNLPNQSRNPAYLVMAGGLTALQIRNSRSDVRESRRSSRLPPLPAGTSRVPTRGSPSRAGRPRSRRRSSLAVPSPGQDEPPALAPAGARTRVSVFPASPSRSRSVQDPRARSSRCSGRRAVRGRSTGPRSERCSRAPRPRALRLA